MEQLRIKNLLIEAERLDVDFRLVEKTGLWVCSDRVWRLAEIQKELHEAAEPCFGQIIDTLVIEGLKHYKAHFSRAFLPTFSLLCGDRDVGSPLASIEWNLMWPEQEQRK